MNTAPTVPSPTAVSKRPKLGRACIPRPARPARPQVVVNDDHPNESEVARAVGRAVLPLLALPVMADLLHTRLPDIDVRRTFLRPEQSTPSLKDSPTIRSSRPQWTPSCRLRIEHALADLRKQRGLSQRQLAARLGVAQPVIAKVEAGKSPNLWLRTFVRVVRALNGRIQVHTAGPMRILV